MIPKKHIESTKSLVAGREHLTLLNHMMEKSKEFISTEHSVEFENGDYYLGFHVPWATMVPHLHLHILVGPLTLMGKLLFNRYMYQPLSAEIIKLGGEHD